MIRTIRLRVTKIIVEIEKIMTRYAYFLNTSHYRDMGTN